MELTENGMDSYLGTYDYYVEKKQVKKVNGGKPGFVIYHTNYSMVIDSDISGIRQVKEK